MSWCRFIPAIHSASANPLFSRAISSAPFFLEMCHSFPSLRFAFFAFILPSFLFAFPLCCATPQEQWFLRLRSLHSRAAYTGHLLREGDEVIRAYVSKVSILSASHGTGKKSSPRCRHRQFKRETQLRQRGTGSLRTFNSFRSTFYNHGGT